MVNSITPGFCFLDLRSGSPAEETQCLQNMREELAFPMEVGSRELVYAAMGSLDNEEKLHGKYIHLSKVMEESDFVISEDGKIMQDKVWEEMLEIPGKIDPKVSEVANAYLMKA